MIAAAVVIALLGMLTILLFNRNEGSQPVAAGATSADGCADPEACRPGQACRDGLCMGPPRDLPPGMIWLDGGRFTMGDGCMDNNPRHPVRLSGFAIHPTVSTTEVSRLHDWSAARRNCRGRGRGFDLPTEAQWAYAVDRGRITPAARAEWVRDWYHKAYFRWPEAADDPTGPIESRCEKNPGGWRRSDHWKLEEQCCKVLRGSAYGTCSATQARSFYGPSAASEGRGFRCVWTP